MEEKDMNKGWDEFDERIREALRDFEVPLDVDMFPAIQETLKHRTWIRRFRRIGVSVAAAAVLFLGWVMISPSPEPAVSVVSHQEMPVAMAIPAVEEEADQPDAVVRPSVQQPVASRPAKQSVVVALTEESPVVQSEDSDPVLHQQVPVSVQTQPAPVPQQPQPDSEQSVGTTDVQQTVAENLYLAEADVSGSHRPWSVGLASTLQGGLSGGSNNYNPMASVSSSDGAIFQVGERSLQPLTVPTHHFPLTLALQAQWSLSQDWMIGTGLSYSRLHSQYEALHNNQLQVDVDQVLHYLGIPVFVNYSILCNQRLNVYASLGGMVEKAVCMDFRLRDLRDQVIQERVSVDGFQYSLHAGLGLEYRFLSWLGLFVDPSLAYYFDNHQPMNLRTAQSLQMRLDVGLRLLL